MGGCVLLRYTASTVFMSGVFHFGRERDMAFVGIYRIKSEAKRGHYFRKCEILFTFGSVKVLVS